MYRFYSNSEEQKFIKETEQSKMQIPLKFLELEPLDNMSDYSALFPLLKTLTELIFRNAIQISFHGIRVFSI